MLAKECVLAMLDVAEQQRARFAKESAERSERPRGVGIKHCGSEREVQEQRTDNSAAITREGRGQAELEGQRSKGTGSELEDQWRGQTSSWRGAGPGASRA
jgi:hypothetical protein